MGSTQADVEVSYGVSNDFFRLWLDKRMNYTCALFEDTENYSDNFDQAQDNKLRFLSRMAHIDSSTKSVLDIGCGWGANLEYQATINKVPDVHGFTLSEQQYKNCVNRHLPNTTVTCENYLHYKAPKPFDAIISICMMEHIVTPDDARANRQVDLYRDYFRRAHSWSQPGSYFGLQTITRAGTPRTRKDLEDMRHSTYVIFPGAVTPRVEDIIAAAQPYYEVVECYARRHHYKKTCEHWLNGLEKHEAEIKQKWGDKTFADYQLYLATCIKAFENNWQSLYQYSLRRLD